jgi:hypothetical protein
MEALIWGFRVVLDGELAPRLSCWPFTTREYPPFRLDSGPHEPCVDLTPGPDL